MYCATTIIILKSYNGTDLRPFVFCQQGYHCHKNDFKYFLYECEWLILTTGSLISNLNQFTMSNTHWASMIPLHLCLPYIDFLLRSNETFVISNPCVPPIDERIYLELQFDMVKDDIMHSFQQYIQKIDCILKGFGLLLFASLNSCHPKTRPAFMIQGLKITLYLSINSLYTC